MNQIFDGVYREGRNIATKNKFKGNTVYGEKIISEKVMNTGYGIPKEAN